MTKIFKSFTIIVALLVALIYAPASFAELSISNYKLPPDPGEAGKATLEGIDSDNDGVRDDIQRYIALTYPDSERVREALKEFPKTWQNMLIDSEFEEKSLNHDNAENKILACLEYILSERDGGTIKDFNKFSRLVLSLKAEFFNTKERSIAYIKYNRHLGGKASHQINYDIQKQSCAFDPDSLEN